MTNTYLINIEGLDGSGKSSITRALAEKMNERYKDRLTRPVTTTHFPQYGTKSGDLVKDWLFGRIVDPSIKTDYLTKNMMYALDRRLWYLNHNDILTTPGIIISDRSYMSDLFITKEATAKRVFDPSVLRWLLRRFDKKYLLEIKETVLELNENLHIISLALDTKPEDARKNMINGGKVLDQIEEDNELTECTHNNIMLGNAYINASVAFTDIDVKRYFGYSIVPCYENDRLKSIDEIADYIIDTYPLNL